MFSSRFSLTELVANFQLRSSLTMSSWRFRVCISTSYCLQVRTGVSNGHSGTKDFQVSLSLIACK